MKISSILNVTEGPSAAEQEEKALSPSCAWGVNEDVLSEIQRDQVNLSVWKRSEQKAILDYIKKSSWEEFRDYTFSFSDVASLDVGLKSLQEKLPLSAEAQSKALLDEIKFLAQQMLFIEPHQSLKVQFSKVDTHMCQLFHVDYLRLRLLCTYRGEGTQLLDNEFVQRKGLGKGCNGKIIKDKTKIQTASCFDVLCLKGERYPGNDKNGVVHRSPAMESKEHWRLLLKIDSGKNW